MGLGSVLNLDAAVRTENISFSLRDIALRLSFNRPGYGTLGEQTSARMGRRKAKPKREEGGVQRCFSNSLTQYMGDFSILRVCKTWETQGSSCIQGIVRKLDA